MSSTDKCKGYVQTQSPRSNSKRRQRTKYEDYYPSYRISCREYKSISLQSLETRICQTYELNMNAQIKVS